MSHYTINIKGDVYFIPYTHKCNVQRDIQDIDTEIRNYENKILELKQNKKLKQLELLNERQLIIYKNPYNRNLNSDELKLNKQYLRRQKLLNDYDSKHGRFIEPSI